MAKHKNHSLSSQGLKYKLKIAFCLMSILPLLVSIYLVSTYIFPNVGLKLDIITSIVVSVFIAIVGFLLIKGVFDSVLSISNQAKLIAAGDIGRSLDVGHGDEVGDLSEALNQLTQRIRSNMNELKSYSERTTEINIGIQKRVLVLSSLLQISSLISQSAKLEDILVVVTEKSRLLANSEIAYLLFREEGEEVFSMKVADGINSQLLSGIKVEPEDLVFNKAIKTGKPLILDKQHPLPENQKTAFYDEFKLINALNISVYLRGRVIGILGIGNTKDGFVYMNDDIELLDIFAKQIAIAFENDILTHRLEKLEIKDTLTGLYNEAFIHNRLQEEIKRAIIYRRPCGFILLDVDNFQNFHKSFGSPFAETTLKRIAFLIRDSITEIDRAGRSGDNEFAIVLPEKNKRQAQEIAEEIRKKIEFAFNEERDANRRLTVSGGVSENPVDGIDADTLSAKAKELLGLAKSQGKNCIVGITKGPG